MNIDLEIKEAIRRLLLPIPAETEDVCIPIVKTILGAKGIDDTMYSTYIKLKHEAWREGNNLDPTLKKIIKETLLEANTNFGQIVAEKYFILHQKLTINPLLSFDLSTILLSHLRLIVTFAKDEDMSASKIIRLLKSIDNRLSAVSWKEIQDISSILGFKPELNQEKVHALYEEDERIESEYFADSGIEDACYQIGEVSAGLHTQGDTENLLRTLTLGSGVHLPYLQVLYYQCIVGGFYDHELTRIYEFAPRGITANWLFAKWNNLTSTSNPVLNNLKSVDVLDENWARSKKPSEIEQASALVELLKGLDGLGFAALKELSAWIRRFLIRYINLNSVEGATVPKVLNTAQISRIFDLLISSPTATFGILEQRMVDLFTSLRHPREEGWRSRGLGDSVNANNLSTKKLGDCDFQNSVLKTIIAYEAHGGTMSRVYFDGHMRTLARALERRKEELEGTADLSDWKIDIVFVAYEFKGELPNTIPIGEFSINAKFITFSNLLQDVDFSTSYFLNALEVYFIGVINDRRTPAIVRQKIIAALT